MEAPERKTVPREEESGETVVQYADVSPEVTQRLIHQAMAIVVEAARRNGRLPA